MTNRRSPWMVKIHELLADGHWHDREQLVTAAMPTVPPGIAVRAAQKSRADWRRNHQGGQRDAARESDDQAVGARHKVTASLGTAIKRGHLERRTVNGVVKLRLAPSPSHPLSTRER